MTCEWNRMLESVAGLGEVHELTLMMTVRGARYRGGLLLVGRAVNGLKARFRAKELSDVQRRRQLIEAERERIAGDACSLSWVVSWAGDSSKGYNPNRSAFWRVARGVARGLSLGSEQDWSSHLAWGNLYRVSPYDGGNPSWRLQQAQLPSACRILEQDLSEFAPKRVLFLTGWDWLEPFASELEMSLTKDGKDNVDAAGTWAGVPVVVARHPQGKPEAPMVERVLNHFGS